MKMVKFYEDHGNYVKLFDGKREDYEITSTNPKKGSDGQLLQTNIIDKRGRKRNQWSPSSFLDDNNLGPSSISNFGKHRRIKMKNNDASKSDSYWAKVKGNNINENEYKFEFSKNTANKCGGTKKFVHMLMTETLYVLNNDPAEPRHAPVVGTKCIMYYRPKDDGLVT